MFPNTVEAWVVIIGSCFISFLLGQWLRRRRKKAEASDDYVEGLKKRILAESREQKRKMGKKKQGKKNKGVAARI